MMRKYAEENRGKEAKKKGLVILRAFYGDEAALGNAELEVGNAELGVGNAELGVGNGKSSGTKKALDVTVALQFMVKESKLRLYAGSKKDYIGFCDVSEGPEKTKLYVRYAFNGFVYELEVDDAEPVYLPAFRATLLGSEELVK